MLRKRKGFTLVELIVVIVIIGILAAIAAPAMTANVKRAKRSEAVAALGALRTAAKLYYAEKGTNATARSDLSTYIADTDLQGPNYSANSYTVTATTLSATATGIGWVNMSAANGTITEGDL